MTTRRAFLGSTLTAAAAFSLPRAAHAVFDALPLRRQSAPKKVVLVGGGLAGLTAAFELQRAGHDVTLLEARHQAGGRVRTLRDAFGDGLYAELGGQAYYPVEPNYAAKYIEEFGLSAERGSRGGLTSLYYVGGGAIRPQAGSSITWPLSLTAEEQQLGLNGIRQKYLAPVLNELATLITSEGWSSEAIDHFDGVSFAELLRSRGASDAAVELLRLADFDYVGEGAQHYSALDMLGQSYNVRAASRYLRGAFIQIDGGNDLLPRAFATRLGDRIRYGAAVTRIHWSRTDVSVSYRQLGRDLAVTAEYLVCAIPFSVLRTLEIAPAFSPAKMRAIRELSHTSIARTYVQCRRRFWIAEGLSGSATTDLPTTYFWDSTSGQPGTRGVLQGYIMGPHARRIRGLAPAERDAFALEQARRVFTGIDDNAETVASVSWDEEPWSRGGYAWLRPGDGRNLWPHLAAPEGPVHFAGEHTSTWFLHGSMQGAIESGIRAATAINALP